MFSIIVSEKGGAERREAFDKVEIIVGRVQGNDLVLPKGNVSKQHARFLFREGRLIVTDLKSTNGTYVNGRKIAQATVVREGDKVYIGDFVLRVDGGAEGLDEEPREQEIPTKNAENPLNRQAAQAAHAEAFPGANPFAPAAQPSPFATSAPPFNPPPQQAAPAPAPFQPAPVPFQPGPPQAAPFNGPQPGALPFGPPQNAPFGSQQPPPPQAQPQPGGAFPFQASPFPQQPSSPPPAVQAQPNVTSVPTGPSFQPAPLPGGAGPAPIQRPNQVAQTATPKASNPPPQMPANMPPLPGGVEEAPPAPAPVPVRPPTATMGARPGPVAGPRPSAAPPAERKPEVANVPAARPSKPEAVQERPKDGSSAGRRLALLSLMNRVGGVVELAQLGTTIDAKESQRLERIVRDQLAQMRTAGDVPPGLEIEALAQDAMAEICGVGPLAQLLADDRVTEIYGVKPDQLLVRRGKGLEVSDYAFSSEWAARRAILKLAEATGKTIEAPVERRLESGALLIALVPPHATTTTFSLVKKRTLDRSMEDWVRAGGLSKPMATFLTSVIAARVSVFLTGPGDLTDAASALVSTVPDGERLALVHDGEELAAPHCHIASIATSPSAVWAALRMRFDRVFVLASGQGVLSAATDIVSAGQSGVVAALPSSGLGEGFQQMALQWMGTHPGASLESARECVAQAFGIAIEVTKDERGNVRIARIAELSADGAVRDIFRLTDTTFTATGFKPRVVEEAQRRGVTIDVSSLRTN